MKVKKEIRNVWFFFYVVCIGPTDDLGLKGFN
jgi:hypothetical protein